MAAGASAALMFPVDIAWSQQTDPLNQARPIVTNNRQSTYLPPVHIAPPQIRTSHSATEKQIVAKSGTQNANQRQTAQAPRIATQTEPGNRSNAKQVRNESRPRLANQYEQPRRNSVLEANQLDSEIASGHNIPTIRQTSGQQDLEQQFADLEKPIEHIGQTPAPLNTRPTQSNSNRSEAANPQSVLRESAGGNQGNVPAYSSGYQRQNGTQVPRTDLPTLPMENALRGTMVEGPNSPSNLRWQDATLQGPENSALRNDALQDSPQDLEANSIPKSKTCDEFREKLLNTPITSIALDLSPSLPTQGDPPVLPESDWTDHAGNLLGRGTMVELSRGYLIIDGPNGRQKISIARLSDNSITMIAAAWRIPAECVLTSETFHGRCWTQQTVTWHASSLCHKPLYFEDVQLERYGHSAGPYAGPIRSTAHFFVSFITWPYQTAIHPANECVYSLGYYRPGDCAPWLVDPFPISLQGAAREAGFISGGFFLF